MRKIVIAGLLALLLSSGASAQDLLCRAGNKCTDWDAPIQNIYIMICQYPSGGSGYLRFKNANDKDVRIWYTVFFKNGSTQKGSTPIGARSATEGASCSNCAYAKGGGVYRWQLRDIKFRGEKGYW
ncbi:MAG: hypothetical protein H0S80_01385 [Desulfovibrionaceae bacterium]|nr:hypothetical protein [Desulfovibrionaceae bacterium]